MCNRSARECNGETQECNWRHGNSTSKHKSVTWACMASWFTTIYSWACEGNYEINDQPISERVTASHY